MPSTKGECGQTSRDRHRCEHHSKMPTGIGEAHEERTVVPADRCFDTGHANAADCVTGKRMAAGSQLP